jgi:hypothetical protein
MYQLTKEANVIKRISDSAFIPAAAENSEYKIYLKWLEGYEIQGKDLVKTSESNTPLPADE